MADYISREAMHTANRCEWDGVCGDYDGHQIFVDNENMIDSITAADVRPVVHGKWTMDSDRPDTLICTACDHAFDVWVWDHKWMHYCPNCGADMREVGTDG